MRGLAEDAFSRFHQGFAEGRTRMNRFGQIAGHGEGRFGNHLARVDTDHPDEEMRPANQRS